MGAHKFISVILRFGELVSATIVAGILGHYLWLVSQADDHANSRIVYTVAMAGISIVVSIALGIPFKYSFYCFPLDFALSICWFVAFGLLCNVSCCFLNPLRDTRYGFNTEIEQQLNSRGCTSSWYWNSWGFYWGRWWLLPPATVTQAAVGTSSCSEWRVTLAFCFIGAMCWFVSGFLVS